MKAGGKPFLSAFGDDVDAVGGSPSALGLYLVSPSCTSVTYSESIVQVPATAPRGRVPDPLHVPFWAVPLTLTRSRCSTLNFGEEAHTTTLSTSATVDTAVTVKVTTWALDLTSKDPELIVSEITFGAEVTHTAATVFTAAVAEPGASTGTSSTPPRTAANSMRRRIPGLLAALAGSREPVKGVLGQGFLGDLFRRGGAQAGEAGVDPGLQVGVALVLVFAGLQEAVEFVGVPRAAGFIGGRLRIRLRRM